MPQDARYKIGLGRFSLRGLFIDIALFWLAYHERRALIWLERARELQPPFTLDGRR